MVIVFIFGWKVISSQCFQQKEHQNFWCFNIYTNTQGWKQVLTDQKKIKIGAHERE